MPPAKSTRGTVQFRPTVADLDAIRAIETNLKLRGYSQCNRTRAMRWALAELAERLKSVRPTATGPPER